MKIRLPAPAQEHQPKSSTPRITKAYLDSIWGEITVYGVKHMADGSQWVIHCLTGQPIERERAKPIKARGKIIWVGANEELSVLDHPNFDVWKNPGHPTI